MLYSRTIQKLLKSKLLHPQDEILVVCGGPHDRDVLLGAGFQHVTISNVDSGYDGRVLPFQWAYQDAEHLTYPDGSFDVVLVHAGLHHCYSPHRALLQMFRVARRAVLVFEARDSFFLNLAKRLGLTADYELEAVSSERFVSGGVGNSAVPNFIYRWTEREVLKTIRSAEPRYQPSINFFYGLRLPWERLRYTNHSVLRLITTMMAPIVELVATVFRHQGNEFGFFIQKDHVLHPWLEQHGNGVRLSQSYAQAKGRLYHSPQVPRR